LTNRVLALSNEIVANTKRFGDNIRSTGKLTELRRIIKKLLFVFRIPTIVVVGNISATSAVIAGAVKGDIDVCGPVILDTTAIVMGNIKSKSVQINNGAVIEGMCSQCYADVSPTSFFEDYKMEMKRA